MRRIDFTHITLFALHHRALDEQLANALETAGIDPESVINIETRSDGSKYDLRIWYRKEATY